MIKTIKANYYSNNTYAKNDRYCNLNVAKVLAKSEYDKCSGLSNSLNCVKTKKIVYNKSEMMKMMNGNNEMPQQIVLPMSIRMDCIEIKPIDFGFLFNNSESELSWKLGAKITKLVHHENGYLPPKMRNGDKCNKDDLLDFERSIKTVLNKLTPENFDNCVLEIKTIHIESEEKLNCLVEQVFSKAIQEESYSKIYSILSAKFNSLTANGKTFRSILLNKCQTMFKKGLEKQIDEVKEFWCEKIKAEPNERMKVMYEDSVEEQINKVKDKYFGNIRFISELFLQNELPSRIIFVIINKLLSNVTNSIDLEAVCKMLVVLGKDLECEKPEEFQQMFVKVKELSMSKDLDTKTRFKFKDIVDMKNRNWQLRQIQMLKSVVPKTFQDLQAEDKDSTKVFNNKHRF